jgi:ribose transport system substrate-binding protein
MGAFSALILLTACAGAAEDPVQERPERSSSSESAPAPERVTSEETIISVVPKSLDNPVFLDTKQSVEQTAEDLGIAAEWVGPFSSESQSQVEVLQWLVRRDVDAILVSANDPDALTPAINQAVASGIAVATFDSDAPDSKRLFYTGTDNTAAGRTGAEVVLGLLEEQGWQGLYTGEGRPARIVVVTGQREALNLRQRIEGFRQGLEGTNTEIVDLLYCNDDMNLAVQLTEQAATTDPDVIFFIGGWVFYAPPESLARYQEWLGLGGIAVTIDKHYPVLQALKEGRIRAAVGQNFKQMGEVGLRRLYHRIRGGEVEEVYFTPIEVVTPENVDQYLAEAPNFEIR